MLFYSKVLENFIIGGRQTRDSSSIPSALIKNIERILLNYILRRQMQ